MQNGKEHPLSTFTAYQAEFIAKRKEAKTLQNNEPGPRPVQIICSKAEHGQGEQGPSRKPTRPEVMVPIAANTRTVSRRPEGMDFGDNAVFVTNLEQPWEEANDEAAFISAAPLAGIYGMGRGLGIIGPHKIVSALPKNTKSGKHYTYSPSKFSGGAFRNCNGNYAAVPTSSQLLVASHPIVMGQLIQPIKLLNDYEPANWKNEGVVADILVREEPLTRGYSNYFDQDRGRVLPEDIARLNLSKGKMINYLPYASRPKEHRLGPQVNVRLNLESRGGNNPVDEPPTMNPSLDIPTVATNFGTDNASSRFPDDKFVSVQKSRNEYLYPCPICGWRVETLDDLKSHKQRLHLPRDHKKMKTKNQQSPLAYKAVDTNGVHYVNGIAENTAQNRGIQMEANHENSQVLIQPKESALPTGAPVQNSASGCSTKRKTNQQQSRRKSARLMNPTADE